MMALALQLIEANIIHIFFFLVFAAQFYHKEFPLGKVGFAAFAFFIFPGFRAGQLLGITFFNTLNPLFFFTLVAVPSILFLGPTRIGRFVPLIVLGMLLLLTAAHYAL